MNENEKVITVGLLGAGTVGGGVLRVTHENAHEIEQKTGRRIVIKTTLVKSLDEVAGREQPGVRYTEDFYDIINDPEIDIIVELIGGLHPAKEFMLAALTAGKHVVTANKDVVAQFGGELLAAAAAHRVEFYFEASVGGGIPIIKTIKESLTANKITEVMGIVNGTTNYMLTKMTREGCDYASVLHEAQTKGYAESNPAADVEGLDAARKCAILASLAFNSRVHLDDVHVEGITRLTPQDISYATQLGYVIKLLAIAKDTPELGIDVRVHPVFLPKTHPLASVNDVFNAIFIRGNAIGDAMFYGRGAGALPTASAVVSDIITIAREIVHGIYSGIGCTCFDDKPLCPLDKTVSAYYIRLLVDDQPGVLGAIATTFGEAGVSLHSVIQTQRVGEHAEIVVITHAVEHGKLKRATGTLAALPAVKSIGNVIRVEPQQEA